MDSVQEPRNDIAVERDYVWHFRLTPGRDIAEGDDRLTDMVRTQLAALLRCVTLTDHGHDLRVTGFRFLDEPGIEHDVYAADTGEAAPFGGD